MPGSTNTASPEVLLTASGFQLAAVEENPSVMYLLDSELRILYCNLAWDRFALANGGTRTLRRHVIGTHVLDIIPGSLNSFYQQGYRRAIREGVPWEHNFECSSAQLYRLFHMRVLPLTRGSLLVENSLRVERPHSSDESVDAALEMLYRDEDGLIVMCAHCRRTRTLHTPPRWHWVPLFVEHMPVYVSHGLCDTCYSFYFE